MILRFVFSMLKARFQLNSSDQLTVYKVSMFLLESNISPYNLLFILYIFFFSKHLFKY